MIYTEEKRDLFTVPKDYYLAHCISSDFGMGAGIVVEFNKRFDMKNRLLKETKYHNVWTDNGYCLRIDRVFNLITKEKYWNKPTYRTIKEAIICMKDEAVRDNISKIAMPVIGCGLDKLKWNKVKDIILQAFTETDVEILVCVR